MDSFVIMQPSGSDITFAQDASGIRIPIPPHIDGALYSKEIQALYERIKDETLAYREQQRALFVAHCAHLADIVGAEFKKLGKADG